MRLVLKTISYGITHIAVATAVAYAITGNLTMALGLGLIEPIVQTGVFALHDYLWGRDRQQGHKPVCLLPHRAHHGYSPEGG